MERRRLGRSGLFVSEITYGNWLTHGELVARDTALACIQAALEAGITTFDTADVYAQGAAEQVLGEALRPVTRSSVEIATKVCLPTGDGPNDRGLSRKHIMESCHASLRRLGTDYVDLYQAHRFDERTPLDETLIAFDDLVRQGKVLYLGVSEWTAPQIEAALRMAGELGLGSRIVANQPQYNMLWRVIEPQVLPLCEREGIGQVVFQPLAQGVLTGKYQPGRPLPANSRATSGGRAPRFIGRCSARRCSIGYSSYARSPRTPASRWPSSRWPGPCARAASARRSSAPPGPSRSPRTRSRPGCGCRPGCSRRSTRCWVI